MLGYMASDVMDAVLKNGRDSGILRLICMHKKGSHLDTWSIIGTFFLSLFTRMRVGPICDKDIDAPV